MSVRNAELIQKREKTMEPYSKGSRVVISEKGLKTFGNDYPYTRGRVEDVWTDCLTILVRCEDGNARWYAVEFWAPAEQAVQAA